MEHFKSFFGVEDPLQKKELSVPINSGIPLQLGRDGTPLSSNHSIAKRESVELPFSDSKKSTDAKTDAVELPANRSRSVRPPRKCKQTASSAAPGVKESSGAHHTTGTRFSRARGPPPPPTTVESPPTNTPMHSIESVRDGNTRSDFLLCLEHTDKKYSVPSIFSGIVTADVGTTTREYSDTSRPVVKEATLQLLKLMSRRRDLPRLQVEQCLKAVAPETFAESTDEVKTQLAAPSMRHYGPIQINEEPESSFSIKDRGHQVVLSVYNRVAQEKLRACNGDEHHKCFDCYHTQYRRQRRRGKDYLRDFKNFHPDIQRRLISQHVFRTVIYAPQGSGKTTFCAMMRYKGLEILEGNNPCDWPDDTRKSILVTSDPRDLKQGLNKIGIKPDCDEFYRRQRLRKTLQPDYTPCEYSIFDTLGRNTVIIESNQLLSKLIHPGIKAWHPPL
uniref:Orf1 n=1 Tax=Galbut virus TaxID=1654579 RepID=A0A2Z4QKI8_9VIRU|nr:orf1 [Galbut virus]